MARPNVVRRPRAPPRPSERARSSRSRSTPVRRRLQLVDEVPVEPGRRGSTRPAARRSPRRAIADGRRARRRPDRSRCRRVAPTVARRRAPGCPNGPRCSPCLDAETATSRSTLLGGPGHSRLPVSVSPRWPTAGRTRPVRLETGPWCSRSVRRMPTECSGTSPTSRRRWHPRRSWSYRGRCHPSRCTTPGTCRRSALHRSQPLGCRCCCPRRPEQFPDWDQSTSRMVWLSAATSDLDRVGDELVPPAWNVSSGQPSSAPPPSPPNPVSGPPPE